MFSTSRHESEGLTRLLHMVKLPLMNLADYMTAHAIDDATLAARLGISRLQVWRLRKGICRPSWPLAQRLHDATDGAVTPNDFLDLPERGEAA